MHYEIKQAVFESVLSKAVSVLATKDLLPILKNFNVNVSEGSFLVVATDLELAVIAQSELIHCIEPGVAVFPGSKLLDIVKTCADAVVSVVVKDDVAVIDCAGATWSIQLMDAADYPEVPSVEDADVIEITRVVFASALMKVKGAAAKEGVRPALQMIDVSNGNIRASDGAVFRQVHVAELEEIEMQIPLGAVEDLIKLLRSTESDKMEIGQTEDHLLFVVGGDVFLISKANVEYPDVETMLLIPARKNNVNLTVDRKQFIDGIRRVRVNADTDTKSLVMELTENMLVLKAHDKYGDFAEQILDVHYSAAPRTVGVNHENMLDALKAVDSPSISVLMGDDTKTRKSPFFIHDKDVDSVLQQIKI
jgi:DNA polymerase-3 subunit beta